MFYTLLSYYSHWYDHPGIGFSYDNFYYFCLTILYYKLSTSLSQMIISNHHNYIFSLIHHLSMSFYHPIFIIIEKSPITLTSQM